VDHHSIIADIFSVTAPVYILVFIGMFLKRKGLVTPEFISVGSTLVYKVTMPLLLFLAIGKADLRTDVDPNTIVFYTVAVICSILIFSLIAKLSLRPEHQPVFVQGAFRGNHGIIALALTISIYSDSGLTLGSAMVAVAAVLNNALSPIVFIAFGSRLGLTAISFVKQVFFNPMVIGVVAGITKSLLGFQLFEPVDKALTQLASISLPVALLCIGASLSLGSFKSRDGFIALQTSLAKLVWLPLVCVPLGYYLFEFTEIELGILFIFFAVPTAAVSYILAEVSGSDAALASNIVVLTTFLSLFTISAGLYLLQIFNWI
jgi:predicted permease